ncbi:MAG: aspartate 1-decarboxylase, partial [Hydrogenobacter sp.]
SLDASIMASANLLPFEKIEVYNVNNGQRFSTYIIPAPAGSGEVQLNGAASRLGEIGDIIIIASYALFDEKELVNFKPILVYVNEENRILEVKKGMELEALYDR